MGANFSGNDDFMAEINVTPFVDVMLVLLIIFMVTAPMMTEGLEVELPKVTTAEVLPMESDHMILSVKQDGSLFLDEFQTNIESLDSVLKTSVVAMQKQLFLRADKQVPYGHVMEIMSHVRAAGITNLGMIAESRPEPATDAVAMQTETSTIPMQANETAIPANTSEPANIKPVIP